MAPATNREDEVNETEPTEVEVEVTDEMVETARSATTGYAHRPTVVNMLHAALSVSPLPAELQRLREENERLREALEKIAHIHRSRIAIAALSPEETK